MLLYVILGINSYGWFDRYKMSVQVNMTNAFYFMLQRSEKAILIFILYMFSQNLIVDSKETDDKKQNKLLICGFHYKKRCLQLFF